MGKEMKYGILVYLRDQASKGIKNITADVKGLGAELRKGFGAGAAGGFAKMFGGGALGGIAGKLATRPGGVGGFLSDLIKGAAGLALLPVRILNAFASLIPGVGGIISGVVGTVANILQGVIGIVANIAGAVLNVVVGLVQKIIGIVESIIGTIAGILGKLVKVAAVVGLGVGAALAYAMFRGIQRNWKEAQLKAVLARRLGAAWKGAWAEVERVATATPFGVDEIAQALVTLQRADIQQPARYLETLADAAVGAGVSLSELAELFVQVQARSREGLSPDALRQQARQTEDFRREMGDLNEEQGRLVHEGPDVGARRKGETRDQRQRRILQNLKAEERYQNQLARIDERRADLIRERARAEEDARVAAADDLGRARMQLFKLGFPAELVARISTVADLAAVLQQRFGGVARQVDKLDPLGNIMEQVGMAVRDLTAGLADLLGPALNRVAEWLERLRQSPAFKVLTQQVGEMGQAILDKVQGALEWLTTREWSWDNLKRGLSKVWTEVIPAAGDAALATLRWLLAEAKVLLAQLWESVGSDLEHLLARVLGRASQAAREAANAIIAAGQAELEARARKEWEAWHPKGPAWEQATPEEREPYYPIRFGGQKAGIGRVRTAEAAALEQVSDALGAAMQGMIKAGAAAETAAAKIEQYRGEAGTEAAARDAALGRLGGAAAGAAGAALPGKPIPGAAEAGAALHALVGDYGATFAYVYEVLSNQGAELKAMDRQLKWVQKRLKDLGRART